jgi:hypothetical protein
VEIPDEARPDARIALLEGLIDHAPLFPPASLDLPEALAEDRLAQESPHAFALARFVCPASRLGELPSSERALSVVLDAPLEEHRGVEAVEVRFREDLESLAGLSPEIYVEVALDDDVGARLDAIAALRLHAKVRCGGSQVPSTGELAGFVRACRERGIAFKATAGLHHAVRTDDEHGLLNLLAAVVFGDEDDALGEEEADAFRLGPDGFGWRGRVATGDEIVRVRRERLRSIGSCSFFEPIAALEEIGSLAL